VTGLPFLIGFLCGFFVCLVCIGAPFLARKGERVPMRLAVDGVPLDGTRCLVASNFVLRLAGLLNHASFATGDALWLPRTASIHTFGMAFPLDVAFLSGDGVVLALHVPLSPGTRLSGPPGTKHTLELPAGSAARLGLKVGTVVTLLDRFVASPSGA